MAGTVAANRLELLQIADAVAKGARVLCGGQIEDHGGKWLRPTVLVDVPVTGGN